MGIKTYLWFPLLSDLPLLKYENPEYVKTYNGLYGYGISGKWKLLGQGNENFLFTCPNNKPVIDRIFELYKRELDDEAFDGVFLDRIRYPSPANGVEALLTCFCDHCKKLFYNEYGEDLESYRKAIENAIYSKDTVAVLDFLLGERLGNFSEFRKNSIYRMVKRYTDYAKSSEREVGLDLFTPSLSLLVGQDYELLSTLSDWIKPMLYCHAIGPAGIPLELYTLINGIKALDPSLGKKEIADLVSQKLDIRQKFDPGKLLTEGIDEEIIEYELTKLRKLKISEDINIYPGIEVVSVPKICKIDKNIVKKYMYHLKKSKVKGIVLSWNLLSIPPENLYERGKLLDKNILVTEELTKIFPGVKALDRVDIEIKEGEVHALLGENGSGKSTFVKTVVGAYRKDGGKIIFDEREVNFSSPFEAFQNGISIIYQETSLIQELSVVQNVFLGIEHSKTGGILNEKIMKEEYKKVANKIKLFLDPDQPVKELRVAEQKMVEIIKALIRDARFIIMDEPTAALSQYEIIYLFDIIRELKRHGLTILYITHILDEVFEITDRITILRDGKKIRTVYTDSVTPDEIIEMMVGKKFKKTTFKKIKSNKGRVPTLRVENLVKRPRVNGVSFNAYKGEILGITGLTGAGKTETIRLIFGADKAEKGDIFIEGKPVKISSPTDAIKEGIALVAEDRRRDSLIPQLEMFKNITLPTLKIKKFTNSIGVLNILKEIEISKKYIEEFSIRPNIPFIPAENLSGGNQQKVVVSKWIISEPKVLILDEPTQGIDVGAKDELYTILRNLADSGLCVLLVSSDIEEVVRVADRILTMYDGKILKEYIENATKEEITQDLLNIGTISNKEVKR